MMCIFTSERNRNRNHTKNDEKMKNLTASETAKLAALQSFTRTRKQ
jgi:hypothetical protein